jgi:hypothetical protein
LHKKSSFSFAAYNKSATTTFLPLGTYPGYVYSILHNTKNRLDMPKGTQAVDYFFPVLPCGFPRYPPVARPNPMINDSCQNCKLFFCLIRKDI